LSQKQQFAVSLTYVQNYFAQYTKYENTKLAVARCSHTA